MNDTIKISLFFMLVFMWYNGVQQYLTSFLSDSWYAALWFLILIIIYIFFTIWCFISWIFASKVWVKKAIVIGAILYSGFIISLAIKNIYIIYIASGFLWFAASLIWTLWNKILIKDSNPENIWKKSWIFNFFYSLWTVIWLITISLLISKFWYVKSFYVQSILPLLGIIFILFLNKDKYAIEEKKYGFKIQSLFKSKTLRKVSLIWFINFFLFGLIISILPYDIKNVLWDKYIWILSSVFYILLLLLSYVFWKLVDIKWRRFIIRLTYLTMLAWLLIFYIIWKNSVWLISGILVIWISFVINNIINISLIWDVSNEKNIHQIVQFAWIMQNLWAISAFLLSSIYLNSKIYLISIIIVLISYLFLINLFKTDINTLKNIIAKELW